MKKIVKLLLIAILSITFIWININSNNVYAAENYNATSKDSWTQRNSKLNKINDSNFIKSWVKWEKWIYNTLVTWAKDIKNIFFTIAIVFYLIIVIKVLVSENAEEEFNKFKSWVIWITLWIIVMQAAVAIMTTLYDRQELWWVLAWRFIENIIWPIIWLLQVLASVFFLWIAFYSFYQLATANWNDEQAKSWKMSIFYAIIWYIVVLLTKVLVESSYGKIDWWTKTDANIEGITSSLLNILKWINWFVGLIVIIMIIYSWFQILISWWDEEKVKKSKKSIIYIIIWILILIMNYLIVTFFLWNAQLK